MGTGRQTDRLAENIEGKKRIINTEKKLVSPHIII